MDLLTNSYSFEPNGHLYPSVAFPLWICILIVPAIFLWMLVSFRQVAIFLLFDCYVSGHKWEHPHRQKKSTPSPPYRRTAQKQMGCHALQRPMREVTRNGDFLVFPSLGNNLPSNPLLYLPRSLFRAREISFLPRIQSFSLVIIIRTPEVPRPFLAISVFGSRSHLLTSYSLILYLALFLLGHLLRCLLSDSLIRIRAPWGPRLCVVPGSLSTAWHRYCVFHNYFWNVSKLRNEANLGRKDQSSCKRVREMDSSGTSDEKTLPWRTCWRNVTEVYEKCWDLLRLLSFSFYNISLWTLASVRLLIWLNFNKTTNMIRLSLWFVYDFKRKRKALLYLCVINLC